MSSFVACTRMCAVLTLFDSVLPLVGLSASNLGNQIFKGLWRAWLVGIQPFQISSDEFGPASWGSVCGLNNANEPWRGLVKRSFDESKPSGGDKVVKWKGLRVSPDTEVCAGFLRFWSGQDHPQACVVSVVNGLPFVDDILPQVEAWKRSLEQESAVQVVCLLE